MLLTWLKAIPLDLSSYPLLADETAKDLGNFLKLLTMSDPDEPCEDVELVLANVKACESGPLFHFRVSQLGTSIISEHTKKSQQQRSGLVFDRRWSQMAEDMDSLKKHCWTRTSLPTLMGSTAAQFTRIAGHRKFMQNASKAFWKADKLAEVEEYDNFIRDTVLPLLFDRTSAACSQAGA